MAEYVYIVVCCIYEHFDCYEKINIPIWFGLFCVSKSFHISSTCFLYTEKDHLPHHSNDEQRNGNAHVIQKTRMKNLHSFSDDDEIKESPQANYWIHFLSIHFSSLSIKVLESNSPIHLLYGIIRRSGSSNDVRCEFNQNWVLNVFIFHKEMRNLAIFRLARFRIIEFILKRNMEGGKRLFIIRNRKLGKWASIFKSEIHLFTLAVARSFDP